MQTLIFFGNFGGTATLWAFISNFTVISLENTMKDQRKSRQNKKPWVSLSEICFTRYKVYNVIDHMVKNAVCDGFWTKINIFQMRAPQNSPKLLNKAIFWLLASRKYWHLAKTHHTRHFIPDSLSHIHFIRCKTYFWQRNPSFFILAAFSLIFHCIF